MEAMNLKQKLSFLKQHSTWKCMNKKEVLAEHDSSWRTNGLSNLTYSILDCCPYSDETKVLNESDLNLQY